jgi:4'-phosphopantetheinyl transferase
VYPLYNNTPALYGININSFAFSEKRIDTMPPARARKVRSFRLLDDRKRSFAAGLLLETVLGREAAFRIRQHGRGKPYLDGGPYFSVSHSGDWAVLAVCGESAGFDIELVRADRDTALVARRVFHAGETVLAKRDVRMFYRVWTAKESYLKMLGRPSTSVADFCIQVTDGDWGVEGSPETAIRFYEQFDGYAAALCSPAGVVWPDQITEMSGI